MGLRGPRKGAKYAPTLAKEAAREVFREYALRHMPKMLQSQVANAIGIGHLYTRDKAGQFRKIEDEAEVEALLTEGKEGENYWIFTKDPSVQAFTDIMNRTLDKPKEQPQEIDLRATVNIEGRLKSARERLAKRG